MSRSNVAPASSSLHGSQTSHSLENPISNSTQSMRNFRRQSLLLPPITSPSQTRQRVPMSVEATSKNESLIHGYAAKDSVCPASIGSVSIAPRYINESHGTHPVGLLSLSYFQWNSNFSQFKVELNTSLRDPLHFQYDRDRPSAVKRPPSSNHSKNTQYSPHPSYHQNSLPLSSTTRNDLGTPISSHNRTSVASLLSGPQRGQSEPSHSSPLQLETLTAATQPAFDSAIFAATDLALGPVRVALENAWNLAVNNMRHAMSRMNNDFTRIVTQERQKISHLTSKITQLENQLQSMRQESKKVGIEKQDLHEQYSSSQAALRNCKDENDKLRREKANLEIEYRVLAGMQKEGQGESTGAVPSFDISSVLGVVTHQVSKQVEQKMSSILNEIEEQKSLRAQVEQRFTETLQQSNQVIRYRF